jgi:hypothetical protein
MWTSNTISRINARVPRQRLPLLVSLLLLLTSRAASASSFELNAVGLLAPAYADPDAADAHQLGPSGQSGIGGRLDVRFRPAQWVALGVGLDYLQSTHSAPSRHVALPVIVSFIPVRLPAFELRIAVGLGPSWAWYGPGFGANGDRLRAYGLLAEARLEPAIRLTSSLAVIGTLGARTYGSTLINPVPGSYSAAGIESPAAAIDVGAGLRFAL